jgi:Alpha/beta hydrolase family
MAAFVLVHSPLVGPLTWATVADELHKRGMQAIAPALPDSGKNTPPYWKHHAEAVVTAAKSIPPDQAVVLVAHSGAGVLLPAIREAMVRPVAGYLFVDALLPRNNMSRLDLFESKAAVEEFRRAAVNGLLPTWTEDNLREHIPDDDLRHRFVAELRPLPLAVYEEPIPVFEDWPDAPCGYVLFSPVYKPLAEEAREEDWSYAEYDALHFHMLVDPAAVTNTLIDLSKQMGAL